MGGSLGLALKQRRVCRTVVGLVRRPEAGREAETLGAVDWATTEPAAALNEADLVIFSTPVRVIMRQVREFVPFYKAGAIITDMGSTKQAILAAMETLPATVYPIGSHPMCGKEQAGLTVAEGTLYEGAPWILTPLERTPAAVVECVHHLALAVGARPRRLAAGRHDRLVAAISHLPYALAVALVLAAKQMGDHDPAVWEVAASGFRDTSRVAASDVTMMLDILLTNPAAVGELLRTTQSQLDQLAQAIESGDETGLRTMLERAARQRRELYR